MTRGAHNGSRVQYSTRPGAGGVPLGTTQVIRPTPHVRAKTLKSVPAGAIRARLAWGLRTYQRKRVALCRTVRTSPTVQLVERTSPTGERRLVFRGIATCGSVHSCPTCAAVILTERGRELQAALDAHRRERTALVTLTLRHHAGIPLAVLRTLLARAYSELLAGSTGQRFKRALGLLGHVRAAEQTFGENGWHPHLHALFFFETPTPDSTAELITRRWLQVVAQIHGRLWDATTVASRMSVEECEDNRARFARLFGARCARKGSVKQGVAAFREGMTAMGGLSGILPDEQHAVVAESCDTDAAAKYLSKMGCELAGITGKAAKPGHYTNWQIGQRAADGDPYAARLWREHSEALKGARQLTWSRGLRDLLGLQPERPDELLASETEPEPEELEYPLGEIDGPAWDVCARARRQLFLADLYCDYAAGELTKQVKQLFGPPKVANPDPEPVAVWWNRWPGEQYANRKGQEHWARASAELDKRERASERFYMPRWERELESEEAVQSCADKLNVLLYSDTAEPLRCAVVPQRAAPSVTTAVEPKQGSRRPEQEPPAAFQLRFRFSLAD